MLSEECRTAGFLRSADITPLQRYYEPIRHPLVVGLFPGATGYEAYPASALSGRDKEGFSSCSMCPCSRAIANHPAGAIRRIDRSAANRAAFALTAAGSASGAIRFRGHLAFTFVTARELAPIPRMRLSRGFRVIGYPLLCPPSYGASDCYSDRTVSCGTHQPSLDAQQDSNFWAHVSVYPPSQPWKLAPRRRPARVFSR
jgi:hypothetical protein